MNHLPLQMIHMKYQVLFSLKNNNNNKKIECCVLKFGLVFLKVDTRAKFNITLLFVVWKYYFHMKWNEIKLRVVFYKMLLRTVQ